jgi:cysteine synthase
VYYEGIGFEILVDVLGIIYFVGGFGIVGIFMGVGIYFKEHKPERVRWSNSPPQ